MFTPRGRSVLLIVLGGLLWGCTPIFVSFSKLDSLTVIALRSAFVGLLLTAVLVPWLKKIVTAIRELPVKQSIAIAASSSVSTGLFAGSAALTEPSHLYTLFYLFVFELVLWELVSLRILPTRREVIALSCAAVGLTIFAFDSVTWTPQLIVGDAMALLSGLTWVIFTLKSRSVVSDKARLGLLAAGQVVMGLVMVPLILLLRTQSSAPEGGNLPAATQLGWIALLGVTTVVPLMAWSYAVRHLKSTTCGILSLLEVPSGLLLVWLCLSKTTTLATAIAGLFVFMAAVSILVKQRRKTSDAA